MNLRIKSDLLKSLEYPLDINLSQSIFKEHWSVNIFLQMSQYFDYLLHIELCSEYIYVLLEYHVPEHLLIEYFFKKDVFLYTMKYYWEQVCISYCICFSQELAEPSKKLSEETSKSEPAEKDIDDDDDFDPSK